MGCQFVIPVYQRNYTWSAEREVKQYLSDLSHVLEGDYKNHFLGILIYLEKSIDFSSRELSIIDGQQRLTTTFLTLYALKEILKAEGNNAAVQQLEGQCLTNPYHPDNMKYKLKPLVADDDVYRCIVENRFDDIQDTNSTVLKNYNFIKTYLDGIIASGHTANDILMALDKLYVVCVPISEEDNAQKIFESINATGVKLTSADLIRNFLLMNLQSDIQDRYYSSYWKKIEDNVSSNSRELEKFFRTYLAIQMHELVPKSGVYRYFVDWVNAEEIDTETLFKDLLAYAKIYHSIILSDIASLPPKAQAAITDFRKIGSEIPLSLVLEVYKLYQIHEIDAGTLGSAISAVNTYMIRRSICDINSQNISKLFPTTLKKVIETCAGDYHDLVSALNQELVGNNAGTSGSYMPTDAQMHDFLMNANVYNRPALRIILDRLELNDNPAPVDLTKLSVEHLMPQTATKEWLKALGTDEETYVANLHRLGNLTLAAKSDNSKMSNLQWDYKNTILQSTAHLKLNMDLMSIKKWTLKHIEKRTKELIDQICQAFPYPEVSISTKQVEDTVSEKTAFSETVQRMFSDGTTLELKKNRAYAATDKSVGYILFASKLYHEGDSEKYWFSYNDLSFSKVSDCRSQHLILICRSSKTLILDIPRPFIDGLCKRLNSTLDSDGNVSRYHIVIHRRPDNVMTMLLSKPSIEKLDITNFLVKEV